MIVHIAQGTRVLIWNLWQTSEGTPELDFDADAEDIKLQGGEEEVQDTTRKRKPDEGMKRCQAYRHSLREYVAILYLNWPEVSETVENACVNVRLLIC